MNLLILARHPTDAAEADGGGDWLGTEALRRGLPGPQLQARWYAGNSAQHHLEQGGQRAGRQR